MAAVGHLLSLGSGVSEGEPYRPPATVWRRPGMAPDRRCSASGAEREEQVNEALGGRLRLVVG